MPMEEASRVCDMFITVTGCKSVITWEHMQNMKDGAILCNAGHFNVEIEVDKLIQNAKNTRKERHNIVGYQINNDKWIYLLAEGRDGHPAEIMDMSFAIQALSAQYLVTHKGSLSNNVIAVPEEIDSMIAKRKLNYWKVDIDVLTEEQEKYLDGWKVD